LITDEMVEAAAQAIYGVGPEYWSYKTEEDREGYREDARRTLEAIEPMIEKLLGDTHEAGYGEAVADMCAPWRKQ
jgi:hypothetical protein